ncbi:hypothetical protein AMATHDRAFT_1958 [Amanita thiersii Skay4041]|uniref:Peptidase S28 n=1 Tax=Amanita thiersii Skay4041 TaxID=703135 RepID=A0A2A9NNJ4_9AGAR|nr:hypothetical protein AMATHDRAFT_1958 [Amanita thiersii Skay4041]
MPLSLGNALLRTAVLFATARLALSYLPDGRMHANMMRPPAVPKISSSGLHGPVTSRNGTQLPPYDTVYFFDQLIDHDNPSLGTFKQRGPIILMTPGEANADGYDGYLTNRTINGRIAQQQSGSTIVLEHRFYGLSNPKPDLSVGSLQLHTLQQAVDDLVYFANNVHLPMPDGDKLSPANAPWVLVGGSYSGALTSWTMVNKPGVFWAGYASSAVVEAILDFWEYFEPIRQNMPKNCSSDVQAVIEHIDQVFISGNTTAIQSIKDLFGMGRMTHLDDVAGSLRNNLWDWQSLQPTSGSNSLFFKFCDALEVKNGVPAPESGWGLDNALTAWGSYFKKTYLRLLCGSTSVEDCLGTYDTTQPYWTDTSIDNAGRSWFWIVCNEVGYLQARAPDDQPSLVTRLVQPPYDLRQCQQMFPAAFPEPPNVQIDRTNTVYDGWTVQIDRLFFANGIRDPWREATMSAEPVTVKSTDNQPIKIGDGFHCSDLSATNGAIDSTIGSVQTSALASMKTWLAQWTPPSTVAGQKRTIQHSDERVKTKPINAWFRGAGQMV